MKTLNFSDIRKLLKETPKKKMLWSGVKEKSFGIVFGPSKSGKTIFCENLAISIAIGRDSYFDYSLDEIPKKVLFIGLEETWDNRAERNLLQYSTLNEREMELMDKNFSFQPIDFTKSIIQDKDWENLIEAINVSEAEVVFIDSITRMNHGKMEDSAVAEQIMLKLRNISQELNITLFAIHHTPKLHGRAITMDCIKGSAVFAQESDFAIGINRTEKKYRYMKNVFFRYANDDDEFVKEFRINDNAWLEQDEEIEEDKILIRNDRRIAFDKTAIVIDFFDSNPSMTYSTTEVIELLKPKTGLEARQIQTHLSNLSKTNKIDGLTRGSYRSINYSEGGNNG